MGKHAQRDQLFENLSEGGHIRFAELPPRALQAAARVGRGSAWLDFDGDGDLDLAVNNNGGPAQLLENRSAREGRHWLGIRLAGAAPNTHGIGARILVVSRDGEASRSQQRRIRTATSFLSSSPGAAHFGLGTAQQAEVVVTWPDGYVQELGSMAVDRWHLLSRHESRVARPSKGATP